MSEELKQRTKEYALRIMRLCEALPKTPAARMIRNQLLRAGASVGANYRAACRAKSPADFIAKMGTVEEETDETLYRMELLIDADMIPADRLRDLMQEGNELLAIFVSSINTARRNHGRKR